MKIKITNKSNKNLVILKKRLPAKVGVHESFRYFTINGLENYAVNEKFTYKGIQYTGYMSFLAAMEADNVIVIDNVYSTLETNLDTIVVDVAKLKTDVLDLQTP